MSIIQPGDPPPQSLNTPEGQQTTQERISIMTISIVGLFVLASAYTIYLIRPVVLPLIYALLLTLVLKPIHRRLERYFRFPAPLAALTMILAFTVAAVGIIMYLSGPIVAYSEELRADNVKERLSRIFRPISEIQGEIADVAEEVNKITSPAEPKLSNGRAAGTFSPLPLLLQPNLQILPFPIFRLRPSSEISPPSDLELQVDITADGAGSSISDTNIGSGLEVKVSSDEGDMSVRSSDQNVEVKSDSPPVTVQIRDDPMDSFFEYAQNLTFHFTVTLALVFFFLAFGDTMINRLAEVDAAARVLENLTLDVSFYLFTISLINVGLGTAIGFAMWLLGMPNPILWGVLAALLNFIPYIGAIAGTAIVFLVGAITFDQTSQILPIPLVYYLLTAVEGNFLTPMIIGKRFTINPIIVFLWVICWGSMWGIPGMLIALPLLMVFRIVCSKVPSLSRLERVISS